MKDKEIYLPAEIAATWQLSTAQKLIYAVMLAQADDSNVCHLSAAKIGELCGMHTKSVAAHRMNLCRLGYVARIEGTQRNYRLLKCTRRIEDAR